MAKSMSKDSQIILNMLRVQYDIQSLLTSKSHDKSCINLLTFYIIKMFSLRKNFSGKTKKSLSFFDDLKGKMLLDSLNLCYPLISNDEICCFARELSDELAADELTSQYAICIQESTKYKS